MLERPFRRPLAIRWVGGMDAVTDGVRWVENALSEGLDTLHPEDARRLQAPGRRSYTRP